MVPGMRLNMSYARLPSTIARGVSRTAHTNPSLLFTALSRRQLHTFHERSSIHGNPFRPLPDRLFPSTNRPTRVIPNTGPIVTRRHQSVASKIEKTIPRWRWLIMRTFAFIGTFVAGGAILVGAFFVYDAMTYREDLSAQDIPVSNLALNPRRGGPKNLPIIEHFIDDDESELNRAQKHKPKLVLLGTGWANIALLKKLVPGEYHVVVVSPSNYFCFTPLLPSATVGTVELRSLVEPVRAIIHRIRGHFLRGSAEDVLLSEKLIEVSSTSVNGVEERYYVPYDKLVVSVGEILGLACSCFVAANTLL